MEEEVPAKGSICGPRCKARYVMAILASVGMGIIYGLKVGLHVVIVTMVNNTAIHQDRNESEHVSGPKCDYGDVANVSSKAAEDGPFVWSSEVQGLLLSSYFFGYLVAQIPGGRLAELFSAKWVFLFAVAINVVCVLLSPVMSKLHYGGLLAMRVLQGIGGGVTFPACHVLLAEWAPPTERSVMSSIVYAGTSLGTVIFMLLSGVIAGALGWEAVFYIEGGFSVIWLILWIWLIADSPQKQTLITPEERAFITSSLGNQSGGSKSEHPPMPWKAAFTSPAFLAILVAHTCSNWGWYMVLIELPQYMKNVLEFEISQNALLTAIPFFTMWLFSMILSKILDTLLAKHKITATTARKVATWIASVIPMVCFIILCFIECQRELAVTLMTVAITSIGGMFCGFLSNHIDIAPKYAGTLMAVTNTVATIPGIVVPIIVGKLTHVDPTIASWRIIFYITIALYIIEILVYGIFGSGEVQKWNQTPAKPLTEGQPLQDK
jgi:ACS family sodium-dependent inorganic phosphate cotransporter